MRFPRPRSWSRARAATSHTLPFPAGPHLRVAAVGEIGRFSGAAAYPQERWREVIPYRPNVIAAEPAILTNLAEYIFHGVWESPSVDTAIFPLIMMGQNPMPDEQRERIWRAFRVPVYELLIDADEGVLASECEAYDGWHVRHPQLRFDLKTGRIVFQKHGLWASPIPTGLTADGLDGICACGSESPLLRNVRAVISEQPAEQIFAKTVGA